MLDARASMLTREAARGKATISARVCRGIRGPATGLLSPAPDLTYRPSSARLAKRGLVFPMREVPVHESEVVGAEVACREFDEFVDVVRVVKPLR